MCAFTLAGYFSERAFRSAVLVPGNALLLGEHNLWSFLTAHFVSPSWALLALHAGAVVALGWRSEEPGGPHPASRVASTALVALSAAGAAAYAARLVAFMGSANEAFLYTPVAGCAPVTMVAAVLSAEVHGDAPLHAAAAVPTSLAPLLVALAAAGAQHAGLSADALPALVAGCAAWTYLRFFAAHGGEGAPAGDAREAFDFINFAPAALRVPLRPLEKVGSALLRPLVLRVAAAAAGARGLADAAPRAEGAPPGAGSAAAAIYGQAAAAAAAAAAALSPLRTGVGAGVRIDPSMLARLPPPAAYSVVSADPAADRRRIKALQTLDRRLAEMKSTMGRGAAAGVAPALSPSPAQAAEAAETV